MIPSDHFVYFYNEIFKELEKLGPEALDKYYARVADRQAYFTLEAFKKDGLKGMYDYWERIMKSRTAPQCAKFVTKDRALAEAKKREWLAEYGADLIFDNLDKLP